MQYRLNRADVDRMVLWIMSDTQALWPGAPHAGDMRPNPNFEDLARGTDLLLLQVGPQQHEQSSWSCPFQLKLPQHHPS